MKQFILVYWLLFLTIFSYAQEDERVTCNGYVISKNNEIDNVTIYNKISKKGTITNTNGQFEIDLKLNDIIEISALQFKSISVTITKEILDSKLLKIVLTERVHQLDDVLVNAGLTRNLIVDINQTVMPKPIMMDLSHMDFLTFPDDAYSTIENPIMNKGQLKNGINFVNIFKAVVLPVFKSKKKSRKHLQYHVNDDFHILNLYNSKYLNENFEIPLNRIEEFNTFLFNQANNDILLDTNELKRIEFLFAMSAVFLNTNNTNE